MWRYSIVNKSNVFAFTIKKQKYNETAHDEAHDADHKAHDEAHVELNETKLKILRSCRKAKSTQELLKMLGYKSRTGNYKTALANLLDSGLLEMTLPESPRSKSQKYRLSKNGLRLVEETAAYE